MGSVASTWKGEIGLLDALQASRAVRGDLIDSLMHLVEPPACARQFALRSTSADGGFGGDSEFHLISDHSVSFVSCYAEQSRTQGWTLGV